MERTSVERTAKERRAHGRSGFSQNWKVYIRPKTCIYLTKIINFGQISNFRKIRLRNDHGAVRPGHWLTFQA